VLLAQAQIQVRHDVTRAYNKIMVLRHRADERLQAIGYVDDHLKDIERLRSLGVDVELDLLRAESQRKSLDLAATSQDADLQDALASIRSLTSKDLSDEDFQPNQSWLSTVTSDAAGSGAGVDYVMQDTLQGQLTLLDLESSRLVTLGTGPIAAPILKVGINHAFLSIDPATPMDQTYASLTLNAFDWGQRVAEGRQRAQELAAQQKATRDELRQLKLTASQLGIDLAAARKAYDISTDLLQNAKKELDIAETYYRQGKIKETDLLSVFSDFLGAQDQQATALQDVLDKRAEWEALWAGGRP
jgi:outer membrane protein TolC